MAAFIYFKDSNIRGEATQGSFASFTSPNGKAKDKFYHDWIQLTSVTETVTRAIETGRSGTARARSGCVLEDIEIEKEVDRTSTDLLGLCSGGRAIDQVFIHLCTSIDQDGAGPNEVLHPYFEFHLFAVKVTSYSISLQGGDDGAIPTETISLNFDKVQWRYWPIGPLPDKLDVGANEVHAPTMSGWDVVGACRFLAPGG